MSHEHWGAQSVSPDTQVFYWQYVQAIKNNHQNSALLSPNKLILLYIDGLMQKRHNSIAGALELCLFCINSSILTFLLVYAEVGKIRTVSYFMGYIITHCVFHT